MLASPDGRYPIQNYEDLVWIMKEARVGNKAAIQTIIYYQNMASGTERRAATRLNTDESRVPREIREVDPYSQGRLSVPEGVHLLSEKRIGDEEKDRYLNHLRECYSTGHLDEDEFDARNAAMMAAKTKHELDFLLKDLPAIPIREDIIESPDPNSERFEIRSLRILVLGLIAYIAAFVPLGSVGACVFGIIITLFAMGVALVTIYKKEKK
jgi:hypothetical protein